MRTVPSAIENSLCRRRWTKAGAAMARREQFYADRPAAISLSALRRPRSHGCALRGAQLLPGHAGPGVRPERAQLSLRSRHDTNRTRRTWSPRMHRPSGRLHCRAFENRITPWLLPPARFRGATESRGRAGHRLGRLCPSRDAPRRTSPRRDPRARPLRRTSSRRLPAVNLSDFRFPIGRGYADGCASRPRVRSARTRRACRATVTIGRDWTGRPSRCCRKK